jgi:two-component system nitrate/nitrite response regulator NarP
LEDNIEVVGEASNGTDAVAMAKESEPDLILLDLNMKGLSGLDTLKALRTEEVTSRVVILTVSDARQDVVALLKAGADGYLLKDTEPDMLLAQLADVMTGKQILSEPLSLSREHLRAGSPAAEAGELNATRNANPARNARAVQQAGRLRAPYFRRNRQGTRQEPAQEARGAKPRGSCCHVPGAAQLNALHPAKSHLPVAFSFSGTVAALSYSATTQWRMEHETSTLGTVPLAFPHTAWWQASSAFV